MRSRYCKVGEEDKSKIITERSGHRRMVPARKNFGATASTVAARNRMQEERKMRMSEASREHCDGATVKGGVQRRRRQG